MIKFISGDILLSNANVIVQQVNCQGVMGSGLAKQIREKYPQVYEFYHKKCKSAIDKNALLGQNQYVLTRDGVTIANIFSQFNYGKDGKTYTDYFAMKRCFSELAYDMKGLKIAIPYNIGCGLGGGDWNIVINIINDIFKDYDGTVEIWKL